jgi:uncharacterized protein YqgC (DUF456 family)
MRIDAVPLWVLFVGVVLVVLIPIEGGYLLGKHVHRRAEDEKESPVAAIAGSILGLGAFLLALGSIFATLGCAFVFASLPDDEGGIVHPRVGGPEAA